MVLSDWVILTLIAALVGQCFGENESNAKWLKPDLKLEFDSKEVYHVGLLNRLYWTEKNERSTSKAFTGWDEIDVHLLEWPGNVSRFEQDSPVVKWGRDRAKYIEDHCGMEHTGIEMKAYAYKYVYLTWGPHRLTQTYSLPLTIPRTILRHQTLGKLSSQYSYEENNLNVVVAFDIAFVYDTLLLAYSDGIIRVFGLEMGWAELSQRPKRSLNYALSKGIRESIDHIVVQSCCLKTNYCPFGNIVVAYRERSIPHAIYISSDSGENFQPLRPSTPDPGILRVVLSYPEFNTLIIFHGNGSRVKRNDVIVSSITLNQKNPINSPISKPILFTRGRLQGARLGMDSSFLLWDECSVWYSPDLGSPSTSLTRSLFYIHHKIGGTIHNQIVSRRCKFGTNSTVAIGKGGNIGLLDRENVFYLGVDTKTNFSQMVVLKTDMSLLREGTEMSVSPHFDINDRPVLLYPPKFLALPKKLQEGLGKTYERRLGMRLLPKNIYPSDFIVYFFAENVKSIEENQKHLLLAPCETSSLKINNSISQRRKFYPVHPSGFVNFTVLFKSKHASLHQLQFEPKSILKNLDVKMKIISIDQVDLVEPFFWIKYQVEITPSSAASIQKTFRLVFFTKNALRCNFQPRVPIYIKVERKPMVKGSNDYEDQDMAKPVYLKSVTGGETQYLNLKPTSQASNNRPQSKEKGETIKVDSCPLSKMQMNLDKTNLKL